MRGLTLVVCCLALAPPAWSLPHVALNDTINLYGGPGVLEGKFETEAGLPDTQGWTPVDLTPRPPAHWQMSPFQAANLDSATEGNHAWWCGEPIAACPNGGDLEGGYGNNWYTALGWSGLVTDKTLPVTVRVTAVLNLDTEPGYDFVHLTAVVYGDRIYLVSLDGTQVGLSLDESITLQPGDYLGSNRDEVQLEFLVRSDGGWSDEDCSWPTTGAAQIDRIQVTLAQEGLPPVVSPVETCEPGAPSGWSPQPILAVGNFAQLWSNLDDIDPDQDNHSPQWAFLDDGIIALGTGGSYCEYGDWCYGPDSLVINIHGGLLAHPAAELNNRVISPAISLPGTAYSGVLLGLDAYLHNAGVYGAGDPYYLTWDLESTSDPQGLAGWQPWGNPGQYINEAGEYRRLMGYVPREQLAPGALFARILVTVARVQLWNGSSRSPTPAPYFDNVRLQAIVAEPFSAVGDFPPVLQVTCHPNPFNPAVQIFWAAPQAGDLVINIHDVTGALVRTVRSGPVAAGSGEVTWRGDDQQGRKVAAGVYFCRVQIAGEVQTQKLMLLK